MTVCNRNENVYTYIIRVFKGKDEEKSEEKKNVISVATFTQFRIYTLLLHKRRFPMKLKHVLAIVYIATEYVQIIENMSSSFFNKRTKQ